MHFLGFSATGILLVVSQHEVLEDILGVFHPVLDRYHGMVVHL